MADDVRVKMRADSGELRAEFQKANRELRTFSNNVKETTKRIVGMGAGFVGLSTGFDLITDQLDKFDRIGKISTALGESSEDIQRLGLAAELTGTSLETITRLASDLERNLGSADTNPAINKALSNLNLSIDELKGASLKEQVDLFANAYNSAADPTEAYKDLTLLLGTQVKNLIPLLKEGKGAVDGLTSELEVLSSAEVKNIEEFNDSLTRIKVNLGAKLTAGLVDDLDAVGDIALAVGESLIKFTGILIENKDTIKGLILAYAGFKVGNIISNTSALSAGIKKTTAAITAQILALKAETSALGKNTVAQNLSKAARNKLSAEFSGSGLGASLKTGLSNLGPIVATAIAGWEIGSLLERQLDISGRVQKALFGELDAANAYSNDLLITSRARVESASTEAELNREILRIQESIAELEGRAQSSRGDAKQSFLDSASAQRNLLAIAEEVNDAARQRATIKDDSEQTERSIAARNRLLETEKKLKAEREAQVKDLKAELELFNGKVEADIFNVQSEEEKIERLKQNLAENFQNVETLITVTGIDSKIDGATDLSGIVDTINLTAGTDPEVAKTLLRYAEQLRSTSTQIFELNKGVTDTQKDRAAVLQNLRLLEAQATGNSDLAESIQRENKVIALQEELRKKLKIPADEALKLAEKQISLEEKIAAAKQKTADIALASARDVTRYFLEQSGAVEKEVDATEELRKKREAIIALGNANTAQLQELGSAGALSALAPKININVTNPEADAALNSGSVLNAQDTTSMDLSIIKQALLNIERNTTSATAIDNFITDKL